MVFDQNFDINRLCDLLHKFSKVKKSSYFKHYYKKAKLTVTPFINHESISSIVFNYVKGSQISKQLLLDGHSYLLKSEVNISTSYQHRQRQSKAILLDSQNPLLIGLNQTKSLLDASILKFKQGHISEAVQLSNNWLFFLYQIISCDEDIGKKIKNYYSLLNARNGSVKRLVTSIVGPQLMVANLDIHIKSAPSYHSIVNVRRHIISSMRNAFVDSADIYPVKYFWYFENVSQMPKFHLFIITDKLSETNSCVFSEKINKLWLTIDNIIKKSDLIVESSTSNNIKSVSSMSKQELIQELYFCESSYVVDPPNFKKTLLGSGGIGGRKYK